MKKLIFLSFLALSAHAQVVELSEKELSQKFIGAIKDVEVESMLKKTSEFNDCRKQNEFRPGDDEDARNAKVRNAEDCFKKILQNKSPEELEKLSKNLDLQSYGLTQSKNAKDITTYLSNKMHKAMTGIDREEKDKRKLIESMKFKNRKMVDQKDFVDLYSTQLTKNTLFEISRFCFENLRKKKTLTNTTSFKDYWKDELDQIADPNYAFPLSDLNDNGKASDFDVDLSDKDKIYDNIFASVNLGSGVTTQQLQGFFMKCGKAIPQLCKSYKENNQKDVNAVGANACLSEARLIELKKAIKNTQLVADQFDQMSGKGVAIALDRGSAPIKIYDRANEETSIDALTSVTSNDVLNGGYQASDDQAKHCSDQPNDPICQGFIIKDGSLQKAEHNLAVEMSLKKDEEIERAKKLWQNRSSDKKTLLEYLKDNGYADLASKVDSLTDSELEAAINQNFDAKKKALLKSIRDRVSSRQISETDVKNGKEKDSIQASASDAAQERARLARVVLFNNIITSHLALTDKATGKELGRNTTALKKEVADLDSNGKIDKSLFQGLKTDVSQAGGSGAKNGTIQGLNIIDEILGIKK